MSSVNVLWFYFMLAGHHTFKGVIYQSTRGRVFFLSRPPRISGHVTRPTRHNICARINLLNSVLRARANRVARRRRLTLLNERRFSRDTRITLSLFTSRNILRIPLNRARQSRCVMSNFNFNSNLILPLNTRVISRLVIHSTRRPQRGLPIIHVTTIISCARNFSGYLLRSVFYGVTILRRRVSMITRATTVTFSRLKCNALIA